MGEPAADAVVSLRMSDGGEASFPLRQLQGRQAIAAVPWRKTRIARGQAHYPGYFWSATTGGHVIYESRLELVAGQYCAATWARSCPRACRDDATDAGEAAGESGGDATADAAEGGV